MRHVPDVSCRQREEVAKYEATPTTSVSANASKTEPARLMASVIADDGAQATVYDK